MIMINFFFTLQLDHLDFNSSRGRDFLRAHRQDHSNSTPNLESTRSPLFSDEGREGSHSLGSQPNDPTPNITQVVTPSTGDPGGSSRDFRSQPTHPTPSAMQLVAPSTTPGGPRHASRGLGTPSAMQTATPSSTSSSTGGPRHPIHSTSSAIQAATPSTGGPRRAASTSRSIPRSRSVSFSFDNEETAAPQAQHIQSVFFFVACLWCNSKIFAMYQADEYLERCTPPPLTQYACFAYFT